MATISVTLGITSTDATSENLNIAALDSLIITNPIESTSRATIPVSPSVFNILTAAVNTSITYVYVKNVDSTNVITLKDDAGNSIIDLSAGEFAFFPVKGGIGLEAMANTAPCILEYGFWTKS